MIQSSQPSGSSLWNFTCVLVHHWSLCSFIDFKKRSSTRVLAVSNMWKVPKELLSIRTYLFEIRVKYKCTYPKVFVYEIADESQHPSAVKKSKHENEQFRKTHFRASTHNAPAHIRWVSLMLFVDFMWNDQLTSYTDRQDQGICWAEYRWFRALGYGFGGVPGGAPKCKRWVGAHRLHPLTSTLGAQVSINHGSSPSENCKIISLRCREQDAQTRESSLCRQR